MSEKIETIKSTRHITKNDLDTIPEKDWRQNAIEKKSLTLYALYLWHKEITEKNLEANPEKVIGQLTQTFEVDPIVKQEESPIFAESFIRATQEAYWYYKTFI